MKGYFTFFLVAVMTLGLGFLLLTRPRTPHDAPAEIVEVKEGPDASADGALPDAGVADAAAAADASAPKPAAEKPLRVTALGWELVSAGAALGAGDGGAAMPIEVAPETALDAVEARLARGGADPGGADVAILPLPAFVAAYERLRALEPRAFLVVGFSHGREELHAAAGALMKPPPGSDEVKVVGFGPSTASDATARAAGSETATVVGLFALDWVGVPPTRVRLVAPGTPEAKSAALAAITRGATDDRKLAWSTADASRLVPIVAVAPKSVIDTSEPKLRAFAAAWMDGLTRVGADASSVARKLASKEGVPLAAGTGGAPEALALLERFGQIESAKLEQQPAWIGATAKGPLTLETLLPKTWALARGAGLANGAAPDPLPIDARIVTAMGIPAPKPPASASPAPEAGDAGAPAFAALPPASTVLVTYRAVDTAADAATVVAQIGFLSATFERAAFRISAKGGEKAARAIALQAKDKLDLPVTRLATSSVEPQGAFAAVEVVALP